MRLAVAGCIAGALTLSACGGGDKTDRAAAPPDPVPGPVAQATPTAATTATAPQPPATTGATTSARPAAPARKPAKPLAAPRPTKSGAEPLTAGPGPGSKPAGKRADLDNPGTGRGRPVGRAKASTLTADRRSVLRVMRTFLQSLGSGDTVQACAQLTPAGRSRLERRIWKVAPEVDTLPCEAALPVYRSAYGNELVNPRFEKVGVTASRASAVGPGEEAFALRKRNGVWLIDRFGSP